MDWKALNDQVIAEFRANQGKVAQFGDLPVVILHTIGAKSGKLREVPLVLIVEDDGTMLLFGSAAGAKDHPVWVHNLRAQPEIDVELGTEKFRANVKELSDVEASAKVSVQAERTQQFADYVTNAAPRQIPVFTIERL